MNRRLMLIVFVLGLVVLTFLSSDPEETSNGSLSLEKQRVYKGDVLLPNGMKAKYHVYNPPLHEPTIQLASFDEVDFSTPETAYWGMRSARTKEWYIQTQSKISRPWCEKIFAGSGNQDLYNLSPERWKATRHLPPWRWRFDVILPSKRLYAFLIYKRDADDGSEDLTSHECIWEDGSWKVLTGGTSVDNPDFPAYAELHNFFEESQLSRTPRRFREWLEEIEASQK